MFSFPQDRYTDVRIEEILQTDVILNIGSKVEHKLRSFTGAFIRMFDGERWYYSSISNLKDIQEEINRMELISSKNKRIYENNIVKKFEVNSGVYLKFVDSDISKVSIIKKSNLLKKLSKVIDNTNFIDICEYRYRDIRKIKKFYSSKGTSLAFDWQKAGFNIYFSLLLGNKRFSENFQICSNYFQNLKNKDNKFREHLNKCKYFIENAKPIEQGRYTVVLSPMAAGSFAHESFGHKSEADFFVGDSIKGTKWPIGKKVGSNILSIVDDGRILGSGYTDFDDEGTIAKETYLIKNGILEGRLHSASTAAYFNENLTGNARAINVEYEPIVRMTTTFILPGNEKKEQLFSKVKEGIYIETVKGGQGMSTFTMKPSLAYRIRNGKISEPVEVTAIIGNVFETLSKVDGISNKTKVISFTPDICSKMDQRKLSVAFGGPYLRVQDIYLK